MNEILTRERPYQELVNQGISFENIFQRVCEENIRVTMRATTEDEYADKINLIINDCLQSDPNSRPTCLAIKVHLKIWVASLFLISSFYLESNEIN
jgi:serine/threonine protein kinase